MVTATVAFTTSSLMFEGIDPEDKRAILNAANSRTIPAKTVVLHQQTPAESVYLLLSGCARHFLVTPEGKKSILMWLPPGSLFGAAAMLSRPQDYLVSTETVVDSNVAVWRRETFRELMLKYPLLFENSLLLASDYIAHFINGYVKQSAKQRLARVVLTLSQSIGTKERSGIALEVTNEDLASAADVTLFTASRILSRWQRASILLKRRGKLVLPSLELLQQQACD